MKERKRVFSLGWSRRVLLAGLLALLSGCAAGRPEPAAAPPTGSAGPSEAVVKRLGDGREGFVIRETPHLDGESRRAFERANALLEKQEYEKAAELLEEVVEQSPGVSAPYINLAIAYRQTDRPQPAEANLQKALELVPGHPLASLEYGLLLRQAGRFAEARQIYEKTLAVFPDYLPARRNLGILCDLYLHDRACALQQYQLYSEGRPEDEQVKIWIADLQARAD